MFTDGVVDWFHHTEEAGLSVSDVEPIDVKFEWYWSHVRMEVKDGVSVATQPFTYILGIG